MNKLYFILFLFSHKSQGQKIIFTVKDSITNSPLELVTARNNLTGFTEFTNAKGELNWDASKGSSVELSSIGYQNKIVHIEDENKTVLLNSKYEALQELTLGKKRQFSKLRKIDMKASPRQYFSFQFGTEYCTFIENPLGINGKIETVNIFLKNIKDHAKECPKCEVDYVATFALRFYEYDSVRKMPGQEIYGKVVLVEPENKNYKINIDVDPLDIPLPENGVCIGVEIVNTKYKNPKTNFAFIAPAIGFFENRDVKNIKSWVRYRNEGWTFSRNIQNDKFGKKSNTLLIELNTKI